MQTNGSSPIYASRHFWRWLALLTFVLAFVALLRYSLLDSCEFVFCWN